ncbi:guanine nucleotide exchange factor MSS4-like [Oscarella lobularis]|uniref:guanine nucleotide exchange factor MSS4-like n=1 Tax=Oscarella lobularis TaxID=121494 RepID=UPI003313C3BE
MRMLGRHAMSESFSADCVSDGKNAKAIVCRTCGSKVLRPRLATLVDKEIDLPPTTNKSRASDERSDVGETLTQFWLVDDMFTFENVGFSNTVGGTVKYLCCADCEMGPIGWHDIGDRTRYYVAVLRVNYVSDGGRAAAGGGGTEHGGSGSFGH